MDKHTNEFDKERNRNTHPDNADLPQDENRHAEHVQHERDYVSETTARGDGMYDESLFENEKEPIPPAKDRETALTPADTQLPATESPKEVLRPEENRETPKQVLPGNHDLTEEEFSQVAEHPHPTDKTAMPDEAETSDRDIEEYLDTIGKDKNMTRLDQAIQDRADAPDADHPHMHESDIHEERVQLEKDKEMNEADRFNVFKQSRYRGDQ